MTVMPAVNQVEFNPFVQQKELRKVMDENNIRLEAWYPLGHGNKDLLENETIVSLAKKYNKNVGQIILRWIYQEGVISLPKSTNEERMKGNIDIFDFELTDEEMKKNLYRVCRFLAREEIAYRYPIMYEMIRKIFSPDDTNPPEACAMFMPDDETDDEEYAMAA